MGGRDIPEDEPWGSFPTAIKNIVPNHPPQFQAFLDDTYENKTDRRHALALATTAYCEVFQHKNVQVPSPEDLLEVADMFYGWLQSVAVEPGGLEDEAAHEEA